MTRLKSVYGRLCGALQCAALAGALAVGVAPAPGAGPGRRRDRARRPRGAAQEGPRPARDGARSRRRGTPPARDVGRLLGAQQPARRSPAGRAERVRGALERHLRRGPPAQRLAARARTAPRLGQLRGRVPALPHERRPRGQLLRAARRPPRRQGRARGGAGRLAGAARSRRRLRADGDDLVRSEGLHPGQRLAQGAPRDRCEPAARRPARGAAGQPDGREVARRRARQPGALPGPRRDRDQPRRTPS